MRKFGLILATTALVGLAAPALAIEAGTSAQTSVNAGVKSKTSVNVRHSSRGVNKMVQHDRGLHRGFTHSRHLGYAQNRSTVRTKVHASTSRPAASRTTVGAGVSSQ